MQTIDLLTVTKEELAFVAPFTLKSTRKDCKPCLHEATLSFAKERDADRNGSVFLRRTRHSWMVRLRFPSFA